MLKIITLYQLSSIKNYESIYELNIHNTIIYKSKNVQCRAISSSFHNSLLDRHNISP